jgi:hypothetical protein
MNRHKLEDTRGAIFLSLRVYPLELMRLLYCIILLTNLALI